MREPRKPIQSPTFSSGVGHEWQGGVGSTVCSNLAMALKRAAYRVDLLDADMYRPSVPTMFGINGRPQSDGQRIEPLERFE